MSELTSLLKDSKNHLMNGINYMLPFVISGGIILAISILLAGEGMIPTEGVLGQIADIGQLGIGLMVPILSGYIAYSMAGTKSLAAGIIGGLIANEIGAGFIGGIISGFLAGVAVFLLLKIKFPESLDPVFQFLVLPVGSVFIIGVLMLWVVGQPIALFMEFLTNLLNSLGEGNMVVLSLILGAMIGSDCGGPINKVAYSFGAAMIGTINPETGMASPTALAMMAGISAAIAVPSLAIGVATIIGKDKFTAEEKASGRIALIMGPLGITDGAIPFLVDKPLQIAPGTMIGSAIAALAAVLLGAENPAPWGGWIVAPIVTNGLGYIFATLVGAGIGGLIIIALKSWTKEAVPSSKKAVQK